MWNGEILVPCSWRSPVHCPTIRQSSKYYAYYASCIAFSLVWTAEIRGSYFSCLLCISSWKSLSPSIDEEDQLFNIGTRAGCTKVGRRNTFLFPYFFGCFFFPSSSFPDVLQSLSDLGKAQPGSPQNSSCAFQRPPPIVLLQLWERERGHTTRLVCCVFPLASFF